MTDEIEHEREADRIVVETRTRRRISTVLNMCPKKPRLGEDDGGGEEEQEDDDVADDVWDSRQESEGLISLI